MASTCLRLNASRAATKEMIKFAKAPFIMTELRVSLCETKLFRPCGKNTDKKDPRSSLSFSSVEDTQVCACTQHCKACGYTRILKCVHEEREQNIIGVDLTVRGTD